MLVVAVRRALTREVVAFHRACEAAAAAHGGDVDAIAHAQDVGFDLLPDRVPADLVDAELDQPPAGGDARLGEVARLGLGEAALLHLPVGDLQGAVPVVVEGLDHHHAAGRDLDDGDRDGAVLVVPDLRHADLFADDRLGCHAPFHAKAPHGRSPAERCQLCRGVPEPATTDVSSDSAGCRTE